MRDRYSQFDARFLQQAREEELKKLFLELLMHSGGNVDEALEWMKQIADRYGLWPEGMDLEQFREMLIEQGFITAESRPQKGAHARGRPMGYTPTRKAERSIQSGAFMEIFNQLRQDAMGGEHVTPYAGGGGDRLPETRPYEFGDRIQDLDTIGTVRNALIHHGLDRFNVTEEDLSVHEVEHATSCATVLALDISHSMILYGEDRITPAKKVALALAEMIQTRFSKDSLDVILFGDEAFQVDARQLAFVNVGPYHTNTKAALELGQRLLARKKHANKQIVMITDGKPSALTEAGRLYINSFGLDPKIVNKTVEEAQACRRKGILITTFMITSDPYLKQFVERMTLANKGRAFYADLDNLGKFVLADFVKNRRKSV
jgi:uncharacterized protein with von Willebrand factor type A (vWA) domain